MSKPLKSLENLLLYDDIRGYRNGTLIGNSFQISKNYFVISKEILLPLVYTNRETKCTNHMKDPAEPVTH